MTRQHGPFQNMGNFKAIALDYAYWSSLSEEGSLYCLNERQIYIMLALCEYVGWLTRWYNTEDINKFTVQYIQSELMEALMSCVDVSVLVSQAELNLVDTTTSKQIESQALRDILEDRYDGTPESINPNAPTTDFGASGDRFAALCAGLTAFVYQFARSQSDTIRAGQIGGLAAVALVAALLIPGLNFFFIVGASIAVLLGLGTIGVTTETAISALTDKDALGVVICFMRDTLKAQGVSQANWDACLNSYPFLTGSHEAIIADFLKACLHDNYLTILNILGQAYTGVINGDPLPECPCTPPATVILINGAPSIWPTMTITYVGNDGTWDIYDLQSQTWSTAPANFGGGHVYSYGCNIVRDGGGSFYIDEVSNMAYQSSLTSTYTGDAGVNFNPALTYLQCGLFSNAAGTIRVKVRS